MDPELLREHLSRLHDELRQVQHVDTQSGALLSEVLGDIQRLLSEQQAMPASGTSASSMPAPATSVPAPPAPGASASGEPGLPGRLERLAVQFEADHPTLAQSSRRLVDLLVKAGV
jgi:hypothetical protein